jgi:hypothetical protein
VSGNYVVRAGKRGGLTAANYGWFTPLADLAHLYLPPTRK